MAREVIGVKRYVVRLSAEERAHLEAMLRKGKHAASLRDEVAAWVADRNQNQAKAIGRSQPRTPESNSRLSTRPSPFKMVESGH